jgi:hypothetical protein
MTRSFRCLAPLWKRTFRAKHEFRAGKSFAHEGISLKFLKNMVAKKRRLSRPGPFGYAKQIFQAGA